MRSFFVAVICISAAIISTSFCSLFILLAAVVKLVLPSKSLRNKATKVADWFMWLWATANTRVFQLFNRNMDLQIEIDHPEKLRKEGWYLTIANHRSWSDIVLISTLLKDKAPMPKFFLKRELLYVPFLGMACWALDMPFMRRYSRQYLIKHPEKRGQDLEETKKSCEKFKHSPTSIVNYVEGTRFTAEKHKRTKSPYQHLLPPKFGGLAYAMSAMGSLFDAVIDVTLAYPDNQETPFKDMLSGRLKRVVIRVKVREVTSELKGGNYFTDAQFKKGFQNTLKQYWSEKDIELEEIYKIK